MKGNLITKSKSCICIMNMRAKIEKYSVSGGSLVKVNLIEKDVDKVEKFFGEDAAYNLLQDKADVDFMRELFRQQLEAARALIAWRNALPADMDEQVARFKKL